MADDKPKTLLNGDGKPASNGNISAGDSLPMDIEAPDYQERLYAGLLQRFWREEGGVANRPRAADKGGPTNKGLSQVLVGTIKKKPGREDIPGDPRDMSAEQISGVLRKEFFDRVHMDKVARIPGLMADAPQLVHQMFDAGALHGTEDFAKWLQGALASSGFDPRKPGQKDFDGIVGPATRAALEQAVKQGRAKDINNKIVDQRIEYMKTLEDLPDNPGWLTRAESLRIRDR